MEQFLYRIQDLYARLENSGVKLSKYMQVAMILRSLPKSFDGLTTALESRSDEELTIELVKSKLIDESEKLRDRGKLPASMALAPMKEHSEEKQRELVKALRDLKAELKEERKQRAAAVAAKKRLEGDLLDTEAILEMNIKVMEDAMRMRVELQGKITKLQQEKQNLKQQLNQDEDEAGRALKTELMSDSNLPLEEHQLRFAPEAANPEEKEIAATVNKGKAEQLV
ncbi:myosin heavy chain, non-muscle-like [Anopheles cruzii]|uniref:myosin heavy chain, non-muscle-like n=1 Tax=Anopheles cruzii TaxID=68878 RepID=UPI0022EC68E5|nr:myosin heavy chain, non-muscle-like [Anopheles cruzii]XP_052871091.1 myosin heavy chain, non-muscle-like [Anopheles cruzii]